MFKNLKKLPFVIHSVLLFSAGLVGYFTGGPLMVDYLGLNPVTSVFELAGVVLILGGLVIEYRTDLRWIMGVYIIAHLAGLFTALLS